MKPNSTHVLPPALDDASKDDVIFFWSTPRRSALFAQMGVSDALPCPGCIIWRQSCKISPGKLFKMKISFWGEGGGLHVTILALLTLFLGLEHYSSFLWIPRQAFTITFLGTVGYEKALNLIFTFNHKVALGLCVGPNKDVDAIRDSMEGIWRN